MKHFIKTLLVLSAAVSVQSAYAQELKNTQDSLSYAIGVDIANTFKNQKIEINPEVFSRAVSEALAEKAKMTHEQSTDFLQKFFMAKRAEMEKESQKVGQENKDRGQAFLDKNKSVTGVVALPSGLQYQIIKEGTGEKPTVNDRVTVHYAGQTLDGNEFDSSIKRGEPATFGVTQVIKGWTEALQLMPVGSKWKIFIPENMAYGAQAPPAIGPNQMLIFEVELLEIAK